MTDHEELARLWVSLQGGLQTDERIRVVMESVDAQTLRRLCECWIENSEPVAETAYERLKAVE